jgi:hypothetical protein
MVVLNGVCERCNDICNSIRFLYFTKCTSGDNNDINKFIQSTQLSAHDDVKKALEWIPYDRLCNIIECNEFNKVYRANWIDGCIIKWDYYNQDWKRSEPNMFVILKVLNNPASITSEFINKVNNYYLIKVNCNV